jgi:penicillin-binding protein 2
MSRFRSHRPSLLNAGETEIEATISPFRIRFFALVIGIIFAVLLARLWYLQILQGEELRESAEVSRRRQVRSVAPRGIIVDSTGQILVKNSAQFTVFVDPQALPKAKAEVEAVYNQLATVLGKSRAELDSIIKRNKVGLEPFPVAEGIDQHTLARIAEYGYLMPGVDADVEPVRQYPNGATAAHLIGYIAPVDSKDLETPKIQELGYRPGDFIGKDGVESQYDGLLRGKDGSIWYETDARNRRKRELERTEPIPGATLKLALNLKVQKAAEAALGNRKGSVVALDPRDGRVLAMVSYPSYDLNLWVHRPLPAQVYREKISPGLFNRSTKGAIAPGSTFKIVSAAAGLAEDAVSRHTGYHCAGGLNIGSYFKRCHSSGGHGGVSLISAMASSCDVYFYQLGFKVGAEKLAEWGDRFGLGQPTGIDLPFESRGYMPSPARHVERAQKFQNPDTTWYPGFTANTVIGQGDVVATPLQMASVVSAIANGGTVYAPRVLLEATDSITKELKYTMKPEVTHRLKLSPAKIALIASSLRAVVTGGTSQAATLPGIAVAGKSGSAELTSGNKGGKSPTHAWFVCYAPFEKPTIAICVFLESEGQNYHGGSDAAPIARKVLAAHFGIPDPGTVSTSPTAD